MYGVAQMQKEIKTIRVHEAVQHTASAAFLLHYTTYSSTALCYNMMDTTYVDFNSFRFITNKEDETDNDTKK